MIREEPTLRRILKLRSVLIINLLVLFSVALGLGRTYWNNYHLGKEIEALEAQAEELEAKNIEFGKLKSYFESPEFLEEEARLKLGLQKPNEETVVIEGLQDGIDRGEEAEGTGGREIREEKDSAEGKGGEDKDGGWLGNPKKWWKYFFE
jgi:cell division protein FtsB